MAKSRPPVGRKRLPLYPQERTFPLPWLTSVVDPQETFEVIGLGPLTHIELAILTRLEGSGCMAKERVQRRLAAILAADVVGYSRMMEADEAGTLARLKARSFHTAWTHSGSSS